MEARSGVAEGNVSTGFGRRTLPRRGCGPAKIAIVIIAVASVSLSARAATDTKLGNNGLPGSDGVVPGQNGGMGGGGQSVNADAGFSVLNLDFTNTARQPVAVAVVLSI